jgi:hypothetical protein
MLRLGPCIVLCLCFLLIGILTGGCLIALLPGHNRIHLVVMPNQAVNIAPEVGDRIYWTTYRQKHRLPVSFQYTDNPCDKDPSDGSCHFTDKRPKNIFVYNCDNSFPCDPGVGPHSGTGTGINSVLDNYLTQLLGTVVFAIDETLGLLPAQPGPPWPAEGLVPGDQTARQTARADTYDAGVKCDINGNAFVNPANITSKAVHQTVSWAGDPFTLNIDSANCSGDVAGEDAFHGCKLEVNTSFTYTVTDNSCTNQKTAHGKITPQ